MPSFKEEISKKLQLQIDEFEKTPIVVGEKVYVDRNAVSSYKSDTNNGKSELCTVTDIIDDGNKFLVRTNEGRSDNKYQINKSDIRTRAASFSVGANPFIEKGGRVRPINYSFDSIIYEFELLERRREEIYEFDGVKCNEINWNPFIYDKNGNKHYYQRPFCWTLEDKQNLINSIYNGINLGMVLVRNRAYNGVQKMRNNGETELAFKDIIDGKQRLNTIKEFLHNDFQDSFGNYYSDLSISSKNKFKNHSLLQYAEMDEWTKDEDVIYQFLKLNFAGVPQSKEHVEFVKSLLEKI